MHHFSPLHSGAGSLSNVFYLHLPAWPLDADCHSYIGPILDANEFPSRFSAHVKGTQLLGNEGGLIAMILVTWAASFGLDERGQPQGAESPSDPPAPTDGSKSASPSSDGGKYSPPRNRRGQWKNKTESYIREILELIDYHGVLRRPTLDGVRGLLLLLPLMEGEFPHDLYDVLLLFVK